MNKSVFLLFITLFFSPFSKAQTTLDMQIADKALLKKITAQDSGYLQKEEALSILSVANVVASEEYKENEKYIEENDTIAKYYKKTNGNYIILIRNHLSHWFMSNVLIEFSSQGKILKKEIYPYSCCGESTPCSDFNKFDDFFCLKVCSCLNGGIGDNSLFLFKEIAPEDALNRIPLYFWCSESRGRDNVFYDGGKDLIMEYNGIIKKLENDSLIISYTSKEYILVLIGEGIGGEFDSEILETIVKESFDILYVHKDNQWYIAHEEDFEKLATAICFDLTFYTHLVKSK